MALRNRDLVRGGTQHVVLLDLPLRRLRAQTGARMIPDRFKDDYDPPNDDEREDARREAMREGYVRPPRRPTASRVLLGGFTIARGYEPDEEW